MCFSAACVYAFFLFFLERTTLWITRNRQIIAATVMFVHHASSSPREETIFFIVLSEITPNSVPIMLPEPPESIVPPMMDEAIAFISAPLAWEGEPEPT
mgnify:FL=1